MIDYKVFTIGIEEEYMVIDPQSKELISHEQQIVTEGQKIFKEKYNKLKFLLKENKYSFLNI